MFFNVKVLIFAIWCGVACYCQTQEGQLRDKRQVSGQKDCTVRSLGSNGGSFSSPGYPELYPGNAYCEVEIEAPYGHYIGLTFEDFDLGPRENCNNDWVVVKYEEETQDENSVVFCGKSSSTRVLEARARRIKIVFQSDLYDNYSGFHAVYSYVPTAQTGYQSNQGRNPAQPQSTQGRNPSQTQANQGIQGRKPSRNNQNVPQSNQNRQGNNQVRNQGSQLRPQNAQNQNVNPVVAHNNQNKNQVKQNSNQNRSSSNPNRNVGFPPKVCGKNIDELKQSRNSNQQTSRIVGGTKSERGEHPWQVMLWEPDNKAFCGGAVLSDRWVVSAAHCFDPKLTSHIKWRRVWVRLGKFNQLKKEEDEFNSQIDAIYEHPDYNGKTFDSDLALIKLKKSVRFSPTIQPVCLGDTRYIEELFRKVDNLPNTNGNNKGPMGVVTGWGKLAEKGSAPKILQEIQIPLVSRGFCKGSGSKQVTKNMFCAGYDTDQAGDACQGDSGGPFMIKDDNTWFLIGVVSWGIGCGRAGQYGFYTKVNNFHPWIRNIIRSESRNDNQ